VVHPKVCTVDRCWVLSGALYTPSLPSFPHAVYAVMILPLRDCFRVSQGKSGAVADRLQILQAQYVHGAHTPAPRNTHSIAFGS
jgi:hypothetical protein